MAGGTWTAQNKIRPGVYIRFSSVPNDALTAGQRGVAAICEPVSWGPVAQISSIRAGDDPTPLTGYSMTDSHNRFLQEIFKGTNRTDPPRQVLFYRPAASGSAEASATVAPLTVTARYPGVRGNDITVSVTALEEPEDAFLVQTYVAGSLADAQTAKTADELADNDWVSFSGTGALAATAGTPLTGGADGTVEATAYDSFMAAIEPYQFDVLIYDGTETAVAQSLAAFVERLANDAGQYAQLVASGMTAPDSRFVVDCESGVTLEDGTALTKAQACWWLGGAMAGARYNQSLTYARYPGAVSVSPRLTNAQFEAALAAGQLVLQAQDGVVKIEQDINSLVTYTGETGEIFRKNRVVRLCSTIANDIYREFSENFIGVVNNNEAGRSRFKSVIVGYLLDIQANQGIQNFSADDVTVQAGQDIDAVVVDIAIQPLDAIEKIYMSIQLQ